MNIRNTPLANTPKDISKGHWFDRFWNYIGIYGLTCILAFIGFLMWPRFNGAILSLTEWAMLQADPFVFEREAARVSMGQRVGFVSVVMFGACWLGGIFLLERLFTKADTVQRRGECFFYAVAGISAVRGILALVSGLTGAPEMRSPGYRELMWCMLVAGFLGLGSGIWREGVKAWQSLRTSGDSIRVYDDSQKVEVRKETINVNRNDREV